MIKSVISKYRFHIWNKIIKNYNFPNISLLSTNKLINKFYSKLIIKNKKTNKLISKKKENYIIQFTFISQSESDSVIIIHNGLWIYRKSICR